MRTKGELEAEISRAVVRFEKDFLGRGPLETKTYVVEDMVIVRLRNVLTPAEIAMVAADPARGRELIKTYRQRLFEEGRGILEPIVGELAGVGVRSMHTDVSTRTGERVIVFTLDECPKVRAS